MAKQTTLPLAEVRFSKPAAFARHETFHPRFGWFKKGYDLALGDAQVFLRDDAPVRLGVGKNMVRSLIAVGWVDGRKPSIAFPCQH